MDNKNIKYKFWVAEVDGWSAIDRRGKKYMLSVIQNMDYNSTPLSRSQEERAILLAYDCDYVIDGEMIVEQRDLDAYKSVYDNVDHVLENSIFSVSY